MWLEALLRVDSACIQSHCAQRLVVAKVWCVWGEGGGAACTCQLHSLQHVSISYIMHGLS